MSKFIKINPVYIDDVSGPKAHGSTTHHVQEAVLAVDHIFSATLEVQQYDDGHSAGNYVLGQVAIRMKDGTLHVHRLGNPGRTTPDLLPDWESFKHDLGM